MRKMVDLHSHDCGSIRDSIATPDQNASRAKELGSKAVAVTNHGTMVTVPKHYDACCKHDIKPIFGVEMYETDNRFPVSLGGTDKHFHFLLIALNEEGYKNLLEIVSDANINGFHRKPRTDYSVYSRLGKGVLASSGCLASRIPRLIQKGDIDGARQWAIKMRDTFEMFVMEIQINEVPLQRSVNKQVIELAQELGIELIVTGDTHYARKEDKEAHDILESIYGTPYQGNTYYPRTDEEIVSKAIEQGIEKAIIERAIENTSVIAERVEQFELYAKDGEYVLPKFSEDNNELFRQLVREGFQRKMIGKSQTSLSKYAERARQEMETILKMDLAGYFLIVSDALKKAKEMGIVVGLGRGSSAGSLVCYFLDITEVDPFEHGLLFERFIDVTRIELADIDSDIEDTRRYELIDYLIEKYGKDHVAQVGNHVFMNGKSALKPVLKALGIPFKESLEITNKIPDGMTVKDLAGSPMWSKSVNDEDGNPVNLEKARELAEKLEGVMSSVSKHAGGVVITPDKLWNHFPIRLSDGYQTTEYNKKEVAKIGGVKFDFLGLSTLSIVGNAIRLIEETRGVTVDVYSIVKKMDDPEVFKLFAKGDTSTIFQFQANGLGGYTKSIRPETFSDLVACTSMYRPAVLENGDAFLFGERKRSGNYERTISEEDEILGETFGILAYQEQIMLLAHKYAGWSYGQGNKLRKMSADELEELRPEFLEDGQALGWNKSELDKIWTKIVEGSGYGFPKAHAVAYTMLSYITAYLKVHYTLEWYCANLTKAIGDEEEISRLIRELKMRDIEFTLPKYNLSVRQFSPINGKIAFPAFMVKGLGDKAVQALEELTDVPLDSYFEELAKRKELKLNIGHVFTLIQLGVFGEERESVLESYLDSRKGSAKVKESERQRYHSMSKPMAELEKEYFGLYISKHPLDEYHFQPLTRYDNDSKAIIGGTVIKAKKHIDRKGNEMAFTAVETQYGVVEGVIFARDWSKLKEDFKVGKLMKITGTRDGDKIKINKAELIE